MVIKDNAPQGPGIRVFGEVPGMTFANVADAEAYVLNCIDSSSGRHPYIVMAADDLYVIYDGSKQGWKRQAVTK